MESGFEPRRAWMAWALVSVLLIAVAAIAYTIGAQREAVQIGDGTRVVYRHGPWGFWWIFVLFWIFGGMRWIWWGAWGPPRWRYRRYYDEDPREWEEWHRREHERMHGAERSGRPVAPPSGDRTS